MTIPRAPDSLAVCIVEDETRLRDLLVREIAAMGHRAAGFRTAEDALAALDPGAFDVAILDLNLPGAGGMDLFEKIRGSGLDLRVVILTGYGTLESAVKALRWDADDYLTKPCGLSEIESVLARLLAQRRDRARAEVSDHQLTTRHAPPHEPTQPAAEAVPVDRTLEEIEREQIFAALRSHHGHKPAAARQLGISLRTLYNKLNVYRVQGYVR